MKNIAFFTSDITTHGGTQRVVTILANAFENFLGHNVFIYSLKHSKDKPEYEINSNIKLLNLNVEYKLSNFITIIKLINDLNKKNSIDSILGIGCYFNLLLPLIKCSNRLACEHNAYDLPSFKVKAARRIAYMFVEGIISLTKEDEKKYLKMNSNTYVIPNPIPFETIQYSQRQNTVVSIGSLNKRKAIDRLLDVWNIVEQKNNNYELKIYGDGPERENLLKQCMELGLKRVTFMGQTNDIQSVLSASKILTLTSHNEGFPMVLLEAMSCGVPVVSFDIKTGPSEIVNSGVDGFLIEDGCIKDFAEHLLKFMSNESLLSDFSESCITSVQKFSIENIINSWSELL